MYDVVLFGDMPDLQTYNRSSGAHRVATEIREHGYSVLVVDFANYIDYDRFVKIINLAVGSNTLAVGFSTTWFPFVLPNGNVQHREPSKPAMRFNQEANNTSESLPMEFGDVNEVGKYFNAVKSINPKTKIVIGGAKAFMYTSLPIHNCFIGHAETMIIDYLHSLSGKGPRRIFNKIIDYDKKAQNPTWDFRKSRIDYEPESFVLPTETLLLEVGRGCRFNCKFCSYPLIGQKNVEDYLKFEECLYNELLDNWTRFGTWKYAIVDDTFNDSTEKLEMMKRVVDRLPFKPAFWCYMRLDLIVLDKRQIQLAKDIGIREVYFGIETLNREAGKVIGKAMNPQKITDTLEECAAAWGNDVWMLTGLICGLPNDTTETFEASCRYFDRPDRPVGHINVTPLRIIKHTDYTKHRFNAEFEINAEQYGYSFPYPDVLWRWVKNDGTDIDTFEKATELAVKWQKQLDSHMKVYKGYFYKSCLLDPKFDFNALMKVTNYSEYHEQVGGHIDWITLIREQIEEHYFKKLFEFLELKRTQSL
jgi:radical SAM superfamily enzyme YgiQ (UPF0313 family)